MSNYITVATYNSNIDLFEAKHLLESAGIECNVQQEMASTYAVVPNADSNNLLRVLEKDAKEAMKIIEASGYKRASEGSDFMKNHSKALILLALVLCLGIIYAFLNYA